MADKSSTVDEVQVNQGSVQDPSSSDAYYTQPTQQIDFERRLAAEKDGEAAAAAGALKPKSYAVEGNDLEGYVGVSPEYMTYANETHRPGVASEGAEAEYEKRLREAPAGVAGAVTEPVDEEKADEPKPREGRVPATGPADKSGAAEATKGGPART